jgi:hypothetical protein
MDWRIVYLVDVVAENLLRLVDRRPGIGCRLVRNRRRRPHPYFHFDPRPEPVDDCHKSVNGEAPEVRVADAREVGRRDAGAFVCGAHGHSTRGADNR